MRAYYRIVEMKDGEPHSLFHGTGGTRKLIVNKWLTADIKIVNDGSRPYVSGFHLFSTYDDAFSYLMGKFKNIRNKLVISCQARKLRPKPTNPDKVLLAEQIRIVL